MSVWVLADLHLAFGNPKKSMEVFGPTWKDYANRIRENWTRLVQPDDLVLIPGDISWALNLEDALIDLRWIDALPGQKLLIRGNHDYWWPSATKLRAVAPPSINFLQNSAFEWRGIAFGGARLWDTREYAFDDAITYVENALAKAKEREAPETERIFVRELERLKLSLGKLSPSAKMRIALTHYPPIGKNLHPSRASAILEDYAIDLCVFGHLHSVKKNALPFGKARGVDYLLTSADYLDFTPIKIVE